jgi:hypothetical protein
MARKATPLLRWYVRRYWGHFPWLLLGVLVSLAIYHAPQPTYCDPGSVVVLVDGKPQHIWQRRGEFNRDPNGLGGQAISYYFHDHSNRLITIDIIGPDG